MIITFSPPLLFSSIKLKENRSGTSYVIGSYGGNTTSSQFTIFYLKIFTWRLRYLQLQAFVYKYFSTRAGIIRKILSLNYYSRQGTFQGNFFLFYPVVNSSHSSGICFYGLGLPIHLSFTGSGFPQFQSYIFGR